MGIVERRKGGIYKMNFIYNDGGRSKYFKGSTGDCVTRAVAIANGKDYLEVYNAINEIASNERKRKRERKKSNARKGVYHHTYEKYLKSLGWKYVSLEKKIAHLTEEDIPKEGIIICKIHRHLTCIIDGVINDTYNCSTRKKDRKGNPIDRRLYGYFKKGDV